jgi:hypothetical protein
MVGVACLRPCRVGRLRPQATSNYEALHRHGIPVRTPEPHSDGGSPQLNDADWLGHRFSKVSAPKITRELGVSPQTVYVALECHGIDVSRSPWLNLGHVRLTPPDEVTLHRIWGAEETIKGVARQFGVSVNTAAAWLADVGIFINNTPVISRRDLQDAIDKRLPVADICRQHHVTGRTVAVELRRHALLEAHNKRHLR